MSMYQQMRYGGYPAGIQPVQPMYGQGHSVGYMHPMDAQTFRQYYTSQLATLTFNSRPIIQNLSLMAQEYSRMAHVVAQCLESHIRLVSPSVKLPALYLVDAIAKNVPVPYAAVLAECVVRIFIDAYEAVDHPTRSKMEEMLGTWRNGSPHGREVFGVVAQRNLENFVASKHSSSKAVFQLHEAPRPAAISKAQVLTEIDVLIAQKERYLAVQFDVATANQLATLRQLHTAVQVSDLSQVELSEISSRLRQPNPVATGIGPTTVPVPTVPHMSNLPVGATPTLPVGAAAQDIPSNLRAFLSQLAPPAVPANIQPTPSNSVNLSTMLSSLLKAGVVSSSATPDSSGATIVTTNAATKSAGSSEEAQLEESLRQYEDSILGLNISPIASEIISRPPRLVAYMYERLSYQCKQCAVRFANGPEGKQQLEHHLDMHFRQNSRGIQTAGRGYSRSWFIGLNSWVHENKPGTNAVEEDPELSGVKKALRESFVVVPHGDETKPVSCPICKELLKPEFLEEDEEWVWKNAVSFNGKIYHATCHADAATPSNILLSRIKQQSDSRSRSGTPEPATQANDILRGVKALSSTLEHQLKRKVPDGESPFTEREGTPPSKRFAA